MSAEAEDGDGGWIAGEDVEAALSALAGGFAAGSGRDLGGFAQGGLLDVLGPGPELAAVAAGGCDPAVLATLTDNQVLGLAAAGRRLAGRAASIQHAAVAEFAARRAEPDRKKATPLGFTPFAADELVPELMVTTNAAELQMAEARDASRRLPRNVALLRDGRISAFQLKIIADATQCLSDADAGEADTLIAAAAPDLTPGQLRAMCTKVVRLIDPAAAQQRKDKAAKEARVVRFQEYSGNAALCGRDLPPKKSSPPPSTSTPAPARCAPPESPAPSRSCAPCHSSTSPRAWTPSTASAPPAKTATALVAAVMARAPAPPPVPAAARMRGASRRSRPSST